MEPVEHRLMGRRWPPGEIAAHNRRQLPICPNGPPLSCNIVTSASCWRPWPLFHRSGHRRLFGPRVQPSRPSTVANAIQGRRRRWIRRRVTRCCLLACLPACPPACLPAVCAGCTFQRRAALHDLNQPYATTYPDPSPSRSAAPSTRSARRHVPQVTIAPWGITNHDRLMLSPAAEVTKQ
jgi:hypothetical protein